MKNQFFPTCLLTTFLLVATGCSHANHTASISHDDHEQHQMAKSESDSSESAQAGTEVSATKSTEHNHHDAEHNHHDHAHSKVLKVPDDQPAPEVGLVIHDDAMKGWNLEVKLTNFEFAPEAVNQASSFNEGHAHLYIDGEKIARLYGSWHYLPELAPGDHEIMVTLNANGHETLQVAGKPVMATQTLTVPAAD